MQEASPVNDGSPAPVDTTPDAGPAIVDPGIISSSAAYGEHEPSVTATSNGRVAVVWVAGVPTGYQIRYRISSDDGVSFASEASIPMPAKTNICSNTGMAVDASGDIYLVYGCEQKSGTGVRSNMQVLVARSPAGSTAFGDSVVVTDPALSPLAYDQPRIAVTGAGGLLVTYAHFSNIGSQEIAAWSDDGVQWTRTPILASGIASTQNMGRIYASPTDERVWVAMLLNGNLGVRLCRSTDGGRTWPVESQHDVSERGGTSLSFDLAIAGHNDDIWMLYGLTDDPPGVLFNMKLSQLHLVHSGDGGDTLETPVKIDDPAAGKYLMLANLAHDDLGGVDITYYAATDPGDTAASYRRRRSTDGGKTFAPSIVVHQPLVFEMSRTTEGWLGDYEGLASVGGKLYMSYAESDGSAAHIAFQRASVP